jgi:DMSO/TMAO reductase YedYZ molybdopterin-dependent catalytic subunit
MTRWTAAFTGLLATAAATSVGELLGRVMPGATSPLLAVGRQVVARTPTGIRQSAINAFGTGDKPAVVVGLLVTLALIGAITGLIARRSRGLAVIMVVVLAAIDAAAAAAVPASTLGVVVTAAVVSGACGAAVLLLLQRIAPAESKGADSSRRRFLTSSVGVIVGTGLAITFSRVAVAADSVEGLRRRIRLPRPLKAAPAVPRDASFDQPGLTPLITDTAQLYRVDTAFEVPQIDPRSWTLRISGLVDRELTFTYEELLAMPQSEAYLTLGCVGNDVGGPLIGTPLWQGPVLADLLRQARPQQEATQLVGRSVDGYTGAFPLAVALDGRPGLLALGLNGAPLPLEHGFPARTVVAGLYGYESAVEWLSELRLVDDSFDAFWDSWIRQVCAVPNVFPHRCAAQRSQSGGRFGHYGGDGLVTATRDRCCRGVG